MTPLDKQPEPPNTAALKREIGRRWSDVDLINILKEVDLRLNFTSAFRSTGSREALDATQLQQRLLLCLFGLGTNIGLKGVASQQPNVNYEELRYVKRRFVQKDALRAAIAAIVNGTFEIRQTAIWGDATTACASDSKQFGVYDQNLMTEWHARYGGRGVMIYWHVEKHSTCIYSQLRRCSSSEVAAMIEGVLRHCTDMEIQRQYVDSHGQSSERSRLCLQPFAGIRFVTAAQGDCATEALPFKRRRLRYVVPRAGVIDEFLNQVSRLCPDGPAGRIRPVAKCLRIFLLQLRIRRD